MLARCLDHNSVRPPVRLSVCLSVRLPVTRELRDETIEHTADILIPYERAITSFLTPTEVDGRRSLPPQIFTQSDPPLKKAELDQYLL